MCGRKGKHRKLYFLLPINRRYPATSWEIGPQYTQGLLLKTNILIMNDLSWFLLTFTAEHDIILTWNIPLVILGQLSWLSTQTSLHFQPTGFWQWENWTDSLNVVWTLLSRSQNTGVLSTPFSLQTQSTMLSGLLWGKWTPPQPDQMQYI